MRMAYVNTNISLWHGVNTYATSLSMQAEMASLSAAA
jgi:hypothetical protein